MDAERYSTTITYVDHTCGAIRPHHAAIILAVANDGRLPDELSDLLRMTKAPCLNADGSVRWIVDWA